MTARGTQRSTNKSRILVIDDEEVIRKALLRYLKNEGYDVVLACDGKEGLAYYQKGGIDLVLTDLMMPEMSGQDVVEAIHKINFEALVIIMTAYGTIPGAVEAIRAGAYHYVTKPFKLDDLGLLVRKSLEYRQIKQENVELKRRLEQRGRSHQFIGQSSQIRRVFEMVEKVAATDSTVLILGESGTGKELIVKAIHEQSERRDNPLVTVNCAAMPEGLLESEFFGHVKGAFTGATANREGRFAQADRGTIFLDEIADMSFNLQVKLLRVLQERRFEPVGSNQPRTVDVRILTATNRNLEKMVKEETFREDLYYRLNVIPIEIPPLRERRSDIPLLMDHFLDIFCRENNKKRPELTPEVTKALLDYSWPGNVRELENMMERLIVLNRDTMIDVDDLPPSFWNGRAPRSAQFEIPEEGVSFKRMVSDYERNLLLSALKMTEWNKNRAANLLSLNRTTLIEKIKKLGLETS